jgi:hypothetical protein
LPLRSEYDRIYLYRCLASGQSAQPERYRATVILGSDERHMVAKRLETFLTAFRLRGHDTQLGKWRQQAEHRLDLKLHLADHAPPNVDAQRRSALRALAGYLLEVKQRDVEELEPLLARTRVFQESDEATRRKLLEELHTNPPFFFEQPELDAKGGLADAFLQDLASLSVRVMPLLLELDLILANAAAFLRREPAAMQRLLDDQCRAALEDRTIDGSARLPRMSSSVCRRLLESLDEDEGIQFLYGKVQREWPQPGESSRTSSDSFWLLGTDRRFVLLTLEGEFGAAEVWQGEGVMQVERVDGWLSADCRLRGGRWIRESLRAPALLVPGGTLRKFDDTFGPLIRQCRPIAET